MPHATRRSHNSASTSCGLDTERAPLISQSATEPVSLRFMIHIMSPSGVCKLARVQYPRTRTNASATGGEDHGARTRNNTSEAFMSLAHLFLRRSILGSAVAIAGFI